MFFKVVFKGGGKEKLKVDFVKKQKFVEDKIFGLKNKNKSKNVQKYVQSLYQFVQNVGFKCGVDDFKVVVKVWIYLIGVELWLWDVLCSLL